MTQLSRIFRDADLVPPITGALGNRRKSSNSSSFRSPYTEQQMRYEAEIEKCPLLMTFEQFHRFIEDLAGVTDLFSKLALLVLPEGRKYEDHWKYLLPEKYPLSLSSRHDLSPLQDESVLGDWLIPSLCSSSQSMDSSKPVRGITLWEKNLEQVF